jgi:hypothetical protein
VYIGDEDGVDRVKMEDDGVMALGGDRWMKSRRKAKASSLAEVGHTSTSGVWWFRPQNHRCGLVVWASKPSVAGLRLWASKPGRKFRRGTDSTWRHRGVRVETKLPVKRRGGRRIKIKTGLDLYALGLNGLAHLYQGANRGLCNSPVK